MKTAGHRLFLALFVPEEMRAALCKQAQEWVPTFGRELHAVPAENLHLTVAFLGNVPAENAAPLITAVREICAATAPLRLRVAGCGAFPNAARPRILSAGVEGDVAALEKLASRISAACEPLAPKMARNPFNPHLTLARPDVPRANPPLSLQAGVPVFGEWKVDALVLAHSHLGHGLPRYEACERFPFAAVRPAES